VCQRRFHYDHAFEQYLRQRAIPYVAVDEARRALCGRPVAGLPDQSLKSFDFVVYGQGNGNLLIDVKGRKHSGRSAKSFDNWVTRADVESLAQWQRLFGRGFRGAFAFLYWCEAIPPQSLFQDVFTCDHRWYALLAVTLEDYRRHLRPRSTRWDTVSIAAAAFREVAQPLKHLL
jgi:hypothetical protein